MIFQKVQVSLGAAKAQGQGAQSKKQAKAQANRTAPLPLAGVAKLSLWGGGRLGSRSLGRRRRRFGGGVPGWLTPGRLSRGLFWCLGLPPGGGVYPHGLSRGMGAVRRRRRRGRLARAGLRRSCRGGLLERVLHREGPKALQPLLGNRTAFVAGGMTALWACDFRGGRLRSRGFDRTGGGNGGCLKQKKYLSKWDYR